MLRRFIFIRNVGRFKNSAATPNPQLGKSVFIHGANGYGKTTLCAVLRSLQCGSGAYVTGRRTLGAADEPNIELLLDDNAVARFANGAWNRTLPDISIFDGTFVAENVYSGDVVDTDQRRNLYRVIIGHEGVALAEEESRLTAEARTKTTEITASGRVIQQHVPNGMTLAQFLVLPAEPGIDTTIAEHERSLAALRQSASGSSSLSE